ncbi:MAG: DegV family protein [Oscillospiraceae bacterium]|nr:DegV family protein [Oscillospiraceae bacterium]MBR2890013.1 DegV family protein [Oscillospiraceae bacterium]
MSSQIILLAETGSDLPVELARELGVCLVPMHVSMGDITLDDGTFPPEDVCEYYDRTGKIPTTSGSTPYDFEVVYEEIFARNPDAQVLHLAYSAVTTCSYHSSQLALEGKPYAGNVRLVDTKHVSAGQSAVVIAVAEWLRDNPQASLEEAAAQAEIISRKTRMCFVPNNLNYLRAGGRCSNAVALVGNLLNLHPCIEILDGRLIACKKYRGAMTRIAPTLLREFGEKNGLGKDKLILISTPYMDDAIRTVLEEEAHKLGYRQIQWIPTGCVITCHGGPGAFGIVGMT